MLSILISGGIANGLIYSLIALGIVILVKSTDSVNFSHGDLVTLGGFVSYTILVMQSFSTPVAFVAVICVSIVMGIAIFALLNSLLKPEHAATLMVATIGVSFVIKGSMRVIWGGQGDYLPVPPFTTAPPLFIGTSIIIPAQQLVVSIGAVIVLLTFAAFFQFTRVGLFMRASADNSRAATIVGINRKFILCLAVVLTAVVGGVSGFLLAPSTLVYPDLGFSLFLKGFAGAILGGIFSLPGAVLGGILIGLAESLAAGYVATQIQEVSAFVIIVLTLLVRPEGIFGQAKKRVI